MQMRHSNLAVTIQITENDENNWLKMSNFV